MSKFCGNCGTQMDDDARVCGNCGTPFADIPDPSGISSQTIPGVGEKIEKKPIQSNKTFKRILAGVIAVIVLIVAANIVSSFTGYKGTVRQLFNALEKYDMNKLSALASDISYDYTYDTFGTSESELQDLFSKAVSNTLDTFEKDAGNKIKIKYKIDDAASLSSRKLDQFLQALEDEFDYNTGSIKKVVSVDITITVKGSKKTAKYTIGSDELLLIKENNGWKVFYTEFNRFYY